MIFFIIGAQKCGTTALYKHNPKARLIFLVREPVSRAISEYNMGCYYAIEENLHVREDPERKYF